MARPSEQGDRPELGSSAPFSNGTSQTQFAPGQHHPYYGTEYPPLDHDIAMSEPFSQSNQQNTLDELQNAAAAVRNNSHAISVNTNGSTSVSMGPPHTPHQQSPRGSGDRPSVDFTPDGQGGLKRKRSKVSRACDECRRKKVKCDADDGEGAEIKTCSNCEKTGMKCEFSRVPMRRGPSKGYINALASRVEKVEQEQAAIHRLSMDASSIDPVYSPEEVLSGRRQFSFSESKSPFGPVDYQRDRIPSVGPWNVSSTPTSAQFRARDRGSLAIAPDQQLPPTSYPAFIKPPWSEFEEPPPAKRQKFDSTSSSSESVEMDPEHFNDYYASIHPSLPLLPDDRAVAIKIVQKGSPPFQHFFISSLNMIPHNPSGTHDPRNNLDENRTRKSSTNFEALRESIIDTTSSPPRRADAIDRLLFAWSATIIATQVELNLSEMFSKAYSRTKWLVQAGANIRWLKNADMLLHPDIETTVIKDLAEKAWNIIVTLGRFHSFATGGTDFVSVEAFDIEVLKNVPPTTNLICAASNPLALNISMLQARPTPADAQFAMTSPFSTFRWVAYCAKDAGLDQEDLTVRKLKVFYDLILARLLYDGFPDRIIQPTTQLAALLKERPSSTPAEEEQLTYSILDIHLYSVTAFTLIEFLNASADPDFVAFAKHALGTIEHLLEHKVRLLQHTRSKLPTTGEPDGLIRDEEGHLVTGASWMEVLLRYIQDKSKAGWASERKADDAARPSPQQALYNFGEMLRKGYLVLLSNMALHFARKDEDDEEEAIAEGGE